MSRVRHLRMWLLALATAYAGVVCACDVASVDIHSAHVHHHDAALASSCDHAEDCSSCGIDVQRDAAPKFPALDMPEAPPSTPLQWQQDSHQPIELRHPPPRREVWPRPTPVHRFDILLI